MSEENLIRWVKYNHNVLNGILPEGGEVDNYKKIISELSARNISSMMIVAFDEDSYIIEYLEDQKKKSMKVLISEVEITRMKGIEN